MKQVFAGLFFFVMATMTAQNELTVKLEKIDELKVYNGLTVNLIKSEELKLEIIGEIANQVSYKNKKGTLKLSLKLAKKFDAKKVKINLYYNDIIPELDANQGATIVSEEIFKQVQLSVHAQEGAKIRMNLDVEYLKVKGITGGGFHLKGKAVSQNIRVVSGAYYKGFELESDQTTIYVSTNSNAKVSVSKILDAKAKLSGIIEYTGRPKSVSTAESSGGKISKAQLEKEKVVEVKKEAIEEEV